MSRGRGEDKEIGHIHQKKHRKQNNKQGQGWWGKKRQQAQAAEDNTSYNSCYH